MILENLKDKRGYILAAGPCSAETREQTLSTARQLAAHGVKIFRAGVWKPRTKPGGFEGIGEPALQWLAEVQKETGMFAATEVATPKHLESALKAGLRVFWIGGRTTANPFAVQDIADYLATINSILGAVSGAHDELTILVKNPVNPDLELWIGAIQRLQKAGVRNIGAIHRGFSSYGATTYRNPPEWRIPIELKRRYPDMTLLCDPSHIAGNRDYIQALSQQALDLSFDGLFIESHCDPDKALSDAAQQVTPEQLHRIEQSLICKQKSTGSENLSTLRGRIDLIDEQLLGLLAERMKISQEIGAFKKEHGLPVIQPTRYNNLMQQLVEKGEKLGLSRNFVETMLATIHEESVKKQL